MLLKLNPSKSEHFLKCTVVGVVVRTAIDGELDRAEMMAELRQHIAVGTCYYVRVVLERSATKGTQDQHVRFALCCYGQDSASTLHVLAV